MPSIITPSMRKEDFLIQQAKAYFKLRAKLVWFPDAKRAAGLLWLARRLASRKRGGVNPLKAKEHAANV